MERLMAKWGSKVEKERWRRIKVARAAYAYEVLNEPIMSDEEYDKLAAQIDPRMSTGNVKLDKFFRKEFASHTGQWVWKHPELSKLIALHTRIAQTKKEVEENGKDVGPVHSGGRRAAAPVVVRGGKRKADRQSNGSPRQHNRAKGSSKGVAANRTRSSGHRDAHR